MNNVSTKPGQGHFCVRRRHCSSVHPPRNPPPNALLRRNMRSQRAAVTRRSARSRVAPVKFVP
jgi:hypothetical protein